MSERQQKQVVIVEADKYDIEYPPEPLPEFLMWLNEKVGQIPSEFLSEALIELDGTQEYDATYGTIKISYSRPETDDEMEYRINSRLRSLEQKRAGELRMLAELKAKYEGEQQ